MALKENEEGGVKTLKSIIEAILRLPESRKVLIELGWTPPETKPEPKDITPTEKHIGALVEPFVFGPDKYFRPRVLEDICKDYRPEIGVFYRTTDGANFTKVRLYMGEIPCPMRPYTGTVEGDGPFIVRYSTGKESLHGSYSRGTWKGVTAYCPLKLIEVE